MSSEIIATNNSSYRSAIENLYEPNLNNTRAYYNRAKDLLYIEGTNGDGAGAYVVVWIIANKEFIKRIALIPF